MTDQFKDRFAERVERLAKLHKLHAPAWVICSEVLLVLKGAFGVHPKEMGAAFAEWLNDVARAECGICPTCGKDRPHELHTCDPCLREAAEEVFDAAD